MDFTSLLPPGRRDAVRRRIAAGAAEAARLHALPDRWLANEILRMARDIRGKVPEASNPGERGYNVLLLWDVIPEIARRLGAPLIPNESTDYDTRTSDDARLREIASYCYQNADRNYLREAMRPDAALCPVDFLTREAANGNPVAIALDRVAPPVPGSKDILATHLRSISARRGHPETAGWHPGLQRDPAPAAPEEPGPEDSAPSPAP
jgi:hypothetical protein